MSSVSVSIEAMRFLSPDNMTSLARTQRATDETRISAQRSHNLICLVREGTQGRIRSILTCTSSSPGKRDGDRDRERKRLCSTKASWMRRWIWKNLTGLEGHWWLLQGLSFLEQGLSGALLPPEVRHWCLKRVESEEGHAKKIISWPERIGWIRVSVTRFAQANRIC